MKLVRTNLVEQTVIVDTDNFEEALDMLSSNEAIIKQACIKAGDWYEADQ